jgi:phosphoribosylformylglycinamidine synthase
MDVKTPNNLLYLVGNTYPELGGSEYYKLQGHLGKSIPKVRAVQAKKNFKLITKAIDLGIVKACHDLSEGGLAVAVAEMTLAGGYGAEINLRKLQTGVLIRDDFAMFSESNSRFLVEVTEKDRQAFEALAKWKGYVTIGKVTRNPKLVINGMRGSVVAEASLETLRESWKRTLSSEV